jgi:hypothetical protein
MLAITKPGLIQSWLASTPIQKGGPIRSFWAWAISCTAWLIPRPRGPAMLYTATAFLAYMALAAAYPLGMSLKVPVYVHSTKSFR